AGDLLEAEMGNAEFSFELRQLCDVDRPDDVDYGECFRFCSKNGQSLDDRAFTHQRNVVIPFSFAAYVGDARPTGRAELRTYRFDVRERVFPFFLELKSFDENAFESEYELLDFCLVGLFVA